MKLRGCSIIDWQCAQRQIRPFRKRCCHSRGHLSNSMCFVIVNVPTLRCSHDTSLSLPFPSLLPFSSLYHQPIILPSILTSIPLLPFHPHTLLFFPPFAPPPVSSSSSSCAFFFVLLVAIRCCTWGFRDCSRLGCRRRKGLRVERG